MGGRVNRIVTGLGEILRATGSALSGVMPALRASDGTFGTQRARSAQLAEQRRTQFPAD